jgi:hypothetical protein
MPLQLDRGGPDVGIQLHQVIGRHEAGDDGGRA